MFNVNYLEKWKCFVCMWYVLYVDLAQGMFIPSKWLNNVDVWWTPMKLFTTIVDISYPICKSFIVNLSCQFSSASFEVKFFSPKIYWKWWNGHIIFYFGNLKLFINANLGICVYCNFRISIKGYITVQKSFPPKF